MTSIFGSAPRNGSAHLLDDNQYEISDAGLTSTDPLKFVDLKTYSSRLKQAQATTGLNDAVINAHGKLNGRPVIVSAMEYSFIGGSMGAVVGEAITRAIEKATDTQNSHHYCFGVRRRPHDGGPDQPHAVGKNLRRAGSAG